MKKVLMFLLLVAIVTSVATGCGSQMTASDTTSEQNSQNDSSNSQSGRSASSSDAVELSFWGAWAEDGGPLDSIAEFNKVYPEIKVKYIKFTNTDEGNVKIDTSLLSGQEIDIFYNYGEYRLAPRVENGMLLDITDYIKADNFKANEELGEFYTYQGRYYALPASSVNNSIFINKNLLDEAGLTVPEKWDLEEYREYARKLTQGEGANKIYGTSGFHADNNYWALPARGLLGSDFWYNEEGMSNFDHPAFKKSLQFKYEMECVEKIQFPYTEIKATNMKAWDVFLQKRCAMVVSSNAIARFLKDTDQYPRDFEVVVAPMPTLEKDQSVNYNEGMYPFGYLGIASNIAENKKEAAWKFIKWMSTEGSVGLCWVGHMPTWSKNNPAELTKEFLGSEPKLVDTKSFEEIVLNYGGNGYSDSNFTAFTLISTILTEEMERVLYGEISVDDAIKNMKARSDQAIIDAN